MAAFCLFMRLLPDALIAAIDFAFLPIWLIKSANQLYRQTFQSLVFIGLLLLLTLGNGLIHAEILGSAKTRMDWHSTGRCVIII